MPDGAASCTTDQTTFQKCRRKKFMEWILSKKVPVGFFNGLGKFFFMSGVGPRPKPHIPDPRDPARAVLHAPDVAHLVVASLAPRP